MAVPIFVPLQMLPHQTLWALHHLAWCFYHFFKQLPRQLECPWWLRDLLLLGFQRPMARADCSLPVTHSFPLPLWTRSESWSMLAPCRVPSFLPSAQFLCLPSIHSRCLPSEDLLEACHWSWSFVGSCSTWLHLACHVLIETTSSLWYGWYGSYKNFSISIKVET